MSDVMFSRRAALRGGAIVVGGVAASAAVSAAPKSDPRRSALGQIKMEGALDGRVAIWSYSGLIYAVTPGQRPRAILSIAGGSANWATRQPDGSWSMLGATMSFFRDPANGAFLDAFDNPMTGKRNEVRPNILSGGQMTFPADGSAPHFVGKSRAGETTPGGFTEADPERPLGRVDWTETRDTVMMTTDHSFEVPVQPQLEARTIFCDRTDFFDARVTRMPAKMATTTIVPWLRWMNMADAPGHLIWHCSGEKMFEVDALPADYRARAGASLEIFGAPPAP